MHFINQISKLNLPPDVDTLDGGTGGLHLLGEVSGYKRIIMIDAAINHLPEGTVSLIIPKLASDFPPTLSAHEIGLKDLVSAMALLDEMPEVYLFAVSVKDIGELSIELSSPIQKAIEKIIPEVFNILRQNEPLMAS